MTVSTSTLPMERTVDATLTRKMQCRGVVFHEAPVLSVIDERLRRFLESRIDGPFTITNLNRMAGGASKEQFVVELEWMQDGTPAPGTDGPSYGFPRLDGRDPDTPLTPARG